MSAIEYAVTNPATGETLKTFDDDQRRRAEGRDRPGARRPARLGPRHERRGARQGHRPRRRAAQRAPARSSREIITREMGKPIEQAVGEVEFSAAIYQYYADNAAKLLADEPIDLLEGEGSAFIRRSPVGLLLGIMPWNYPYYQVARFAGPNLVDGQHDPAQARAAVPGVGRRDGGDLPRGGRPAGRLHQHLRDQRADRVGHRRPARAGRVAHRLGPRGRRGGPDRRAPPQEGRARARRLGPVHRARRRRPRRGRRAGRRRPAGEHAARPATRPSASSSSTTSTTRSSRSSPRR